MKSTTQSIKKTGNLNPMFGTHHSPETKKKISNSQKARYNRIRQALGEGDILKYGQTNREARIDVLTHLIDNNDLSFRNVKQAVNFLSIMLNQERIQEIVRNEIYNLIKEHNWANAKHVSRGI